MTRQQNGSTARFTGWVEKDIVQPMWLFKLFSRGTFFIERCKTKSWLFHSLHCWLSSLWLSGLLPGRQRIPTRGVKAGERCFFLYRDTCGQPELKFTCVPAQVMILLSSHLISYLSLVKRRHYRHKKLSDRERFICLFFYRNHNCFHKAGLLWQLLNFLRVSIINLIPMERHNPCR
jgi:hypothetical protein